MIVLDHNPP